MEAGRRWYTVKFKLGIADESPNGIAWNELDFSANVHAAGMIHASELLVESLNKTLIGRQHYQILTVTEWGSD